MSSFGVLDTGFRRKLFETIKAEIEADQKAAFGAGFNTAADSVTGQLNGIFADQLADVWELAQAVYSSFFPNSSSGSSLDAIGLITGAVRLPAAPTSVDVTVYSTAGTVVNVGDTITGSDGTSYRATAAVTVPAATDTIVNYAAATTGPIAAPSGSVFLSPGAGIDAIPASITCAETATYDLTGSPSFTVQVGGRSPQIITLTGGATESAASVASKISAALVGGTASVDGGAVRMTVTTGDPNTLTNTIEVTVDDAVFDWLGGAAIAGRPINLTDGDPGRDLETDADFRVRRQQLLSLPGSSTVEAILSAVGAVDGVTFINVIENDDSVTGPAPELLPPHSFEVVVEGGDDTAIAEAIFSEKPIGIQTHSGASGGDMISKTVTDSQGNEYTIDFSRPTPIYITTHGLAPPSPSDSVVISLTYDPATYGGGTQSAGDAAVKQALDDFIEALSPGDDISYQRFLCSVLDVEGVVDVTAFTYDVGDGAIMINTSIDGRSLAKLDQGDISVTSTEA